VEAKILDLYQRTDKLLNALDNGGGATEGDTAPRHEQWTVVSVRAPDGASILLAPSAARPPNAPVAHDTWAANSHRTPSKATLRQHLSGTLQFWTGRVHKTKYALRERLPRERYIEEAFEIIDVDSQEKEQRGVTVRYKDMIRQLLGTAFALPATLDARRQQPWRKCLARYGKCNRDVRRWSATRGCALHARALPCTSQASGAGAGAPTLEQTCAHVNSLQPQAEWTTTCADQPRIRAR